MTTPEDSTRGAGYAQRLSDLQGARWKRVFDVQRPYRRKLRRMDLGLTLDVGCGVGRNLASLDEHGVGIDHNADSVAMCRSRGFDAFTAEEFPTCEAASLPFASLLFSHVLEHMTSDEAVELVRTYLPYLQRPGRAVFVTPQERGYASDATHVEFMDVDAVTKIAEACGLDVERSESFPFPRVFGKLFTYNEFVVVARAN